MLKLNIPAKLETEFSTVKALWESSAQTRRTDALVLAWAKHEKQLRRMFCFLVFQHPRISESVIDGVISVLADNRQLNPDIFIRGIEELGVPSVAAILGDNHVRLWPEMQKIKKIRNKLAHGQVTGCNIQSVQLERHVRTVVEWISCLADAGDTNFGYDGLQRNTFRRAKSVTPNRVASYPFSDVPTSRSGCRLGLIRFRGHILKGGYDVHDGATNQEPTTTSAV